ncbi:MAG TPA: hypothetical protein VGF95_09295 [Solirubrobacteraceae bacterium]|jgi:hypothetical protein
MRRTWLGVAACLLLGCTCPDAQARGRSPTVPPLVSGPSAYATPRQAEAGTGSVEAGEGGEVEGPASQSEADPLVENGLGSPLCIQADAGLSQTALSDCRTSDFVASAAPTPNYAFDVNIDSGFAGEFQTYIVKPPWTMLVWVVHLLLVGIEWSYTVSLLNGPTLSTLAHALGSMQRAITQPWLAFALAIAAASIAWRGIVRRQAAASLGEALEILALIATGLTMILDPLGTVGALVRLTDSASLEVFAAVTGGGSSHPDEALAKGIGQLYANTINAPWCYMEFGEVAWCEQPSQLDPQLRATALKLAKRDRAEAAKSGAQRAAGLRDSATLLEDARTNGAIFLAQPANGPARNSSKWQGSLLATICKGSSATACKGATASEAEFRTSNHTIDRLTGLMLILAGGLGAVLLLGFVLARLLGAAVLGLLFLLAAPAAVLMPAFGEAGRTAFRGWAGRLFAAIAAKLVWSFLLAVVLESIRVLHMLGGLGWWIQWLLMSALWWGAFHHRHQLIYLAGPSPFARSGARGARNAWRRTWRAHRRRGRRSAGDQRWRDWREAPVAFADPPSFEATFEGTPLPGPPRPPRSLGAASAVEAQPSDSTGFDSGAGTGPEVLYSPPPGLSEEIMAHRRKLVAAKRRRREEGEAELAEVVALYTGKRVWRDPREIEVDVGDVRGGPS